MNFKADKELENLCKTKPNNFSNPLTSNSASIQNLKVEIWSDKDHFNIGEKMKVYVKANQDCFITLIDLGTSKNATILFPNYYTQSNAVKGGVIYTIPDSKAGFEFEVLAPPGLEIIRAIASKEPSVDLTEIMDSFGPGSPFSEVKKDISLLTRDIHVIAKKAKKGEWSEDILRLKII